MFELLNKLFSIKTVLAVADPSLINGTNAIASNVKENTFGVIFSLGFMVAFSVIFVAFIMVRVIIYFVRGGKPF